MSALVESVSRSRLAAGPALALLTVGLAVFDVYTPSPVVAVSTALLIAVVTLRAVQPFGDTVGYHVLQAGAFAVWGLAVVLAERASFLVGFFVVIGVGGVAYYGRQAIRTGFWEPTDG